MNELVRDSTECCYYSANERYSWVRYDFKNRRVIPKSYSLRSSWQGPGGNHLKSWALEVASEEEPDRWTEIDRRENNSDLNGEFASHNFEVYRPDLLENGFRFVRLRQAGPNHSGRYELMLNAFENFGTLIEN